MMFDASTQEALWQKEYWIKDGGSELPINRFVSCKMSDDKIFAFTAINRSAMMIFNAADGTVIVFFYLAEPEANDEDPMVPDYGFTPNKKVLESMYGAYIPLKTSSGSHHSLYFMEDNENPGDFIHKNDCFFDSYGSSVSDISVVDSALSDDKVYNLITYSDGTNKDFAFMNDFNTIYPFHQSHATNFYTP